MAALDFPNAPTVGQVATLTNGFSYRYDGAVWTLTADTGGGLWTSTATTLMPADPVKNVTVPVGSTTVSSIVMGSGTVKAAIGSDGVQTLIHANNGYAPEDATKSSWLMYMAPSADSMGVARRAPSAAAGTFSVPLQLDGAGNLTIAGPNATKSTGTLWINPSDPRLKRDVSPYATGLDAITRLEPIAFTYNGLGGTTADDRLCYGLDASAVKDVMPDCVGTRKAKLRPTDEDEIEMLTLDASNITWALVNAVKELARRVAALETT